MEMLAAVDMTTEADVGLTYFCLVGLWFGSGWVTCTSVCTLFHFQTCGTKLKLHDVPEVTENAASLAMDSCSHTCIKYKEYTLTP